MPTLLFVPLHHVLHSTQCAHSGNAVLFVSYFEGAAGSGIKNQLTETQISIVLLQSSVTVGDGNGSIVRIFRNQHHPCAGGSILFVRMFSSFSTCCAHKVFVFCVEFWSVLLWNNQNDEWDKFWMINRLWKEKNSSFLEAIVLGVRSQAVCPNYWMVLYVYVCPIFKRWPSMAHATITTKTNVAFISVASIENFFRRASITRLSHCLIFFVLFTFYIRWKKLVKIHWRFSNHL